MESGKLFGGVADNPSYEFRQKPSDLVHRCQSSKRYGLMTVFVLSQLRSCGHGPTCQNEHLQLEEIKLISQLLFVHILASLRTKKARQRVGVTGSTGWWPMVQKHLRQFKERKKERTCRDSIIILWWKDHIDPNSPFSRVRACIEYIF